MTLGSTIIRLSFGGGVLKSPERLDTSILNQLTAHEQRFGLAPAHTDTAFRFQNLIRNLHQATGQRVVVLIDEYDKPILDNLQTPEVALEMRDGLRNLYSVLKESDAHLKFVFLTGVSKFSKVNLFSGLNHLKDITIDKRFSALCGYTETDLDTVFAPELHNVDRQILRDWYNGYNWDGEAVYNPFDLLLYCDTGQLRPHWFETGTPTFLVDFLASHHWFTPDLAHLQTSQTLLSTFDVGNIRPEALLWQTGYLTFHQIAETRPGRWNYTLGYPNLEVEAALNEVLLPAYGADFHAAYTARSQTEAALMQHNLAHLRDSFYALFASIPHDWYRNNPLAEYEGYYASVFYSQLAALGLDTRVEDATNKGRIDLALRYQNHVYLFEFKVIAGTALPGQSAQAAEASNASQPVLKDATEGSPTESTTPAPAAHSPALQQLPAKGYADKYRAPGVGITLIGITFSKQERNIIGWETLSLS
ncbi:MAG: AAA family ATPase [Candidatus Sericytochromatia bacterium]|nr:AAA family ATPase [Candidatus Sericytochromatia bacterium]